MPARRAPPLLPELELMREATLTAATSRDEGIGATYLQLVARRLEIPPDRWQMLQHALGGFAYLQRGRVNDLIDQCRREAQLEQSVRRAPLGAYRRR